MQGNRKSRVHDPNRCCRWEKTAIPKTFILLRVRTVQYTVGDLQSFVTTTAPRCYRSPRLEGQEQSEASRTRHA
jgi:uncharacterized protein YchJ